MPRPITITPDQGIFIKEHFQLFTHQALAVMMGIKVNTLRSYCRKNKLYKFRKENANPEPKQIIRPKEKAPHVPPPAEYSAGQEAVVNKYLNLDI